MDRVQSSTVIEALLAAQARRPMMVVVPNYTSPVAERPPGWIVDAWQESCLRDRVAKVAEDAVREATRLRTPPTDGAGWLCHVIERGKGGFASWR